MRGKYGPVKTHKSWSELKQVEQWEDKHANYPIQCCYYTAQWFAVAHKLYLLQGPVQRFTHAKITILNWNQSNVIEDPQTSFIYDMVKHGQTWSKINF